MGAIAEAVRWGVVMPAGPGGPEIERIRDTLESLHFYEPDVDRVVIVDDDWEAHRDLRSAAGPLAERTTVVPNPRPRNCDWWSDGVLIGISAGLELLLLEGSVDWVLRMDTDALVIAPFSAQITDAFDRDPDLALAGSCDREVGGGTREVRQFARPFRKMLAPVSIWRGGEPHVRTSLVGRGRERSQLIRAAQRRGYRFGEHCQGGAYAVSMPAVRRLRARGWVDGHLWYGSRLPEDVIMAVQTCALGMHARSMSDDGEPFAVQHVGIPRDPQFLHDHGYALVHSVKSQEGWTEDELRRRFRSYREADRERASRRVGAGRA